MTRKKTKIMDAATTHYRPTPQQLRKLLRPASVAVIGATDTPGKVGAMITDNLLTGGYAGRVVCVNPNRTEVFGRTCVPSLSAETDAVDCAIVAVPAQHVEAAIVDALPRCRNFVVIAAGFAEAGDEGRAREASLRALADREKLAILGPNCLGFVNPGMRANASFAPTVLLPGRVALLSQSGALAVALLDRAVTTRQGFSYVVSLGNKMQIDETVLLPLLADDPDTDVIALYVEHLADGVAFMAAAAPIADRKPVVLLHGGRTDAGQRASASHTGALTSAGDVFDAACRKVGILQARSMADFEHLVAYTRRYGLRASQGVAIVTNAGGPGVLTADAFAEAGAPLATPWPETRAALSAALPPAAATGNPVDLLGDALDDRYRTAYAHLAHDPATDTVCTIVTPQAQTPVEAIADALSAAAEAGKTAHIAAFLGGRRMEESVRMLQQKGIVTVGMPEDAATLTATLAQRAAGRYGTVTALADDVRMRMGAQIAARLTDERRSVLTYAETQKICAAYSVPLSAAWRMDYDTPAVVTYPCVAKVDATSALHRTDRGGVIVGIRDEAALRDALRTLDRRFPGARVVVQPQADAGMEILVGVVRDPSFGPVVTVAYGGIYTEQIRMTVTLVPPLSTADAVAQLVASRLGFLFRETRGQAPYDAAHVAAVASALGTTALEQSWIAEIDVNPLFIYNDGRTPLAVDVKVVARAA